MNNESTFSSKIYLIYFFYRSLNDRPDCTAPNRDETLTNSFCPLLRHPPPVHQQLCTLVLLDIPQDHGVGPHSSVQRCQQRPILISDFQWLPQLSRVSFISCSRSSSLASMEKGSGPLSSKKSSRAFISMSGTGRGRSGRLGAGMVGLGVVRASGSAYRGSVASSTDWTTQNLIVCDCF